MLDCYPQHASLPGLHTLTHPFAIITNGNNHKEKLFRRLSNSGHALIEMLILSEAEVTTDAVVQGYRGLPNEPSPHTQSVTAPEVGRELRSREISRPPICPAVFEPLTGPRQQPMSVRAAVT